MLTFCFSTVSIAQSDIVDVALSSKDHTTLVAAIKAADLVNTLKGKGPFTVFAPTNAAFDALPKGTLESLLKPESKSKLASILTYHVVAGNFKAADVVAAIKKGGGKFTIKTVNGGTLTASLKGDNVVLVDANGNTSIISGTDLKASNGVIHVIDSVVLPK
ncbi:fasciclin domain-containing protein [uncultured Dokdonia sp.]|uniref:fasciclin domain-containing protein n=1 Tax=uncultured Dokdonia sp. TaxID=575653 RepID=UPI00261E53FC|nr:fasciclin domain-containing protein [uncultured Dokdonia sp.]